MYWTPAQMLAHLTVNGASLRTGDLYASGTICGPGARPARLVPRAQLGRHRASPARTFLEDGDEVVLRYTAPGTGGGRITLGEVRGRIEPARSADPVRDPAGVTSGHGQDQDPQRRVRGRTPAAAGRARHLQEWVRAEGARLVVVFEGRDAAGKGGAIKRIAQYLNPRMARVAALPAPTERERTQWYFQRYVEQLPAAGEIVLFDRSWYNRAGVERVMGYCTPERAPSSSSPVRRSSSGCSVEDGILLRKYWFSVSDEEQQRRFRAASTTRCGWKLSPMDLESIKRWEDYSRAKDEMFVAHRHARVAMVRRGERRQEARAAEHDRPPASPDPLHRGPAGEDQDAQAAEVEGVRPPAARVVQLCTGPRLHASPDARRPRPSHDRRATGHVPAPNSCPIRCICGHQAVGAATGEAVRRPRERHRGHGRGRPTDGYGDAAHPALLLLLVGRPALRWRPGRARQRTRPGR